MEIKTKINTMLFVIFFWGFTFLKPILNYFEKVSSTIIIIFICIIFLVSLINNKTRIIISKAYLFPLFLSVIFIIDFIFRRNSLTEKYFIEAIFYSVITIYLLSQISDYKYFLKYFFWFSLIAFLIFGLDPFFDYHYFDNYMGYGFNLIFPVYLGFHLFNKKVKLKSIYLLEIISLIFLILFANRSLILSVFILWIFESLYYKFNFKKILFLIIISLVILINVESILLNISNFINIIGIRSYSISSFLNSLSLRNIEVILSGRVEIWEKVLQLFYDRPIFGYGYGYVQSLYGFYVHNIILDFLVHYGLILSLIIILLLIYMILNIFKVEFDKKRIFVFFLFLWFPKLLLSDYFIRDIGFWGFIAVYYSIIKVRVVGLSG